MAYACRYARIFGAPEEIQEHVEELVREQTEFVEMNRKESVDQRLQLEWDRFNFLTHKLQKQGRTIASPVSPEGPTPHF
jgi:hypothetical protein